MFLNNYRPYRRKPGFPRVRGDVPAAWSNTGLDPGFSPRARGCSALITLRLIKPQVFPACAGMFRSPRHRGQRLPGFSPRARGCSFGGATTLTVSKVFPACAGMFRSKMWHRPQRKSFPRVRGDVPRKSIRNRKRRKFSPRARGCSALQELCKIWPGVFPACAGMFLFGGKTLKFGLSFPRVRGDVPVDSFIGLMPCRFSPRARGCSG